MKDDYKITFIRGATTASGNSIAEIEVAVVELIDELISRNNLVKTNIQSITFTVTKDLDAGPIIEQSTANISHKDRVEDLVRKGRDIEKVVLSRAIWYHVNRRILSYGNRTIIFD